VLDVETILPLNEEYDCKFTTPQMLHVIYVNVAFNCNVNIEDVDVDVDVDDVRLGRHSRYF
jgi:hypothetical protein